MSTGKQQTRAWARKSNVTANSTQIRRLEAAGIPRDLIYSEDAGETVADCIASLRSGDTLALAAIEMLHSTTDGVHEALRQLQGLGVTVWVLDENRRISPDHLADVRLGIEIRKRLTGERHHFDSASGRAAALKRHGQAPAKEVEARWRDTAQFRTYRSALAGTGWTKRQALFKWGPRGTQVRD